MLLMGSVESLWREDPAFRAMISSFGLESPTDVREWLYTPFSKFSPTPSDVHVATTALSSRPRRRRKSLVRKNIGSKVAAGIGASGAYGAITTLKPKKKFVKLQEAHRQWLPQVAQAQDQRKKRSKAEEQREMAERANLYKSVDWEGEFSKVDSDKRQVFGWASIVKIDGKPVIDRQGDWIDEDEMEKSAYEYVIKSRKGGDQHRRTEDGDAFHASDMIESFVVTDEKKDRLGLPDAMPTGWWVGFKVNDDDTWRKVKNGEVTGFSIHGKGKRLPVDGVINPVSTNSA